MLNSDSLARIIPSAFAKHAAEGASDRYQFIPTTEVIEALTADGWLPTKASQALVRDPQRQGYQRHLIRFRHRGQGKLAVGDSLTEVVLVNSHDRSSAFMLHAGLFRLVCSNGLVVPDSIFGRISIRHVGFDRSQVLEASYRVLDNVGRIAESVEIMRSTMLSSSQRLDLAEQALRLRWSERAPIEPMTLLSARRYEDKGNDLWRTFNVIQENLLQGGQAGLTSTLRKTRTRAVRSISEQIGMNKALWDLALKFTDDASAQEAA